MPRPFPRAVAAFAVACALLVAPTPPTQQPANADSLGTLQQQVVKLRGQADRASAALAKSTRRYEDGKARLRSTQRRLLDVARDEQRAQDDVDLAHERLVAFAVSSYTTPVGDEIGAVLTGALTNRRTGRSTTDIRYVTATQADAVDTYTAELDRQAALRRHAKALEREASSQQARLAGQHRALRADSKRLTDQLLARLDRLTLRLVKADRYAAAFRVSRERQDRGGDDAPACDKPTVTGFPNGLIPMALLCSLPAKGEYLRADAARAFWLLDTAYRLRFGSHICVTDGYRPLGEQYAVYRTKPALAAVPGTSRHGRGVAVDLGCGIQNFGSTQFRWMKRNAPMFGWVHPAWAESNPFEPWHWEYVGRG
ncbi:MAG: hypothetical protein GEV10_27955 [Streptosporangiales bacterium]|nr:hypothetical protein [Streptosporangiales bacterium]